MRFRLLLIGLVFVGCDYGRQAPPIVIDLPQTEVAPEPKANSIPAFPVVAMQRGRGQ
ncbi:MAG: hypothetical protein ABJM81_26845 [Rhodopirellula bahusiensis]|uniref:hypothetical protein n=1 Tax=Rhodopirellula bahusiensis TaxID=2014065 RepID=UPI0032636ECD